MAKEDCSLVDTVSPDLSEIFECSFQQTWHALRRIYTVDRSCVWIRDKGEGGSRNGALLAQIDIPAGCMLCLRTHTCSVLVFLVEKHFVCYGSVKGNLKFSRAIITWTSVFLS